MPGRCSWRLSTSKPHTRNRSFQGIPRSWWWRRRWLSWCAISFGCACNWSPRWCSLCIGRTRQIQWDVLWNGHGMGASSNLLPLRLLLLLSPPMGWSGSMMGSSVLDSDSANSEGAEEDEGAEGGPARRCKEGCHARSLPDDGLSIGPGNPESRHRSWGEWWRWGSFGIGLWNAVVLGEASIAMPECIAAALGRLGSCPESSGTKTHLPPTAGLASK